MAGKGVAPAAAEAARGDGALGSGERGDHKLKPPSGKRWIRSLIRRRPKPSVLLVAAVLAKMSGSSFAISNRAQARRAMVGFHAAQLAVHTLAATGWLRLVRPGKPNRFERALPPDRRRGG